MYYLHVTATTPTTGNQLPQDALHGPFATEQEAIGFFTKLQIWYPSAMRDAQFDITDRIEDASAWKTRVRS